MTQIREDPDGTIRVDLSGQKRAESVLKDRAKQTEYSNIDLASGYPRDQIWTTRDLRKIAIPNMSDQHLQNTIAFLHRRAPEYKRQIATKAVLRYTMQLQMFDWDWPEDVAEEKGHIFDEQLKAFMNKPDNEFLRKYCPQYKHMIQEAYKRKLVISIPKAQAKEAKEAKEIGRRYKQPVETNPEDAIRTMMQAAIDCDGLEVHRDDWPVAEEIVKRHPDEFQLGSQRGPNSDWRRLYYVTNPEGINEI